MSGAFPALHSRASVGLGVGAFCPRTAVQLYMSVAVPPPRDAASATQRKKYIYTWRVDTTCMCTLYSWYSCTDICATAYSCTHMCRTAHRSCVHICATRP